MGLVVPHFAGHQDDVFLMAMIAALIATIAICLPIVVAPQLARAGMVKRVATAASVVAAVALCAFAWQAVINVGVLVNERADVQGQIARTYALQLTVQQADELIDGGRPEVALPARAAGLGLTGTCQTLRLVPLQKLIAHASVPDEDYGLELSGTPLLGRGAGPERAVPCTEPPASTA